MLPPDLVVTSRRVVTPEAVVPAAIHVQGGRIAWIGSPGEAAAGAPLPAGTPVVDAGDSVVMAGLVDTHVHVNEPGRSDWEGFETATRAAAAGGITTLVDMPLNSIPATTTAAALATKREAAAGRCWVDVGFWGGVVPGNTPELAPLAAAGVLGFKAFLVPSGVPEFEPVGEEDLRSALPELARLGAVLLVHAELPGPLAAAERATAGADPRSYGAYLASRPPQAESEAVALLVRLAAETGARIHVVHLSSGETLEVLARARAAGLPVTAETCPHYLFFAAEEIADGATEWKCAPPIRGAAERDRLWRALAEGLIDLVASDHSPSPPAGKHRESGDFRRAWGGISSLQLALPAVWTAARRRGHSLVDLSRWMCRRPAELAGLAARKGAIAPGLDADLVLWDPEASFEVEPERLEHRHKLTPYAGLRLDGVVRRTFLRGETAYDRGSSFPALLGGSFPALPGGSFPPLPGGRLIPA